MAQTYQSVFIPGLGAVNVSSLVASSYIKAPAGTPAAPGLRIGGDDDGLIQQGGRIEMVYNGTERAYWGATNHNYQGTTVTGSLTATTLIGLLSGPRFPTRSITANHIMTADDGVVYADATAGNITISLPAIASLGSGALFCVSKHVASANTVTIDPDGAETIDGAATLVVASNTAVWFQAVSGVWRLIARE